MSRFLAGVRLALLIFPIGIAIDRQTANPRVVPTLVELMAGPDWPDDEVSRKDRQWAEAAARTNFGRGPVGYVTDHQTDYDAEWGYYVACYGLAPTVVVPGRDAKRVVLDAPDGGGRQP